MASDVEALTPIPKKKKNNVGMFLILVFVSCPLPRFETTQMLQHRGWFLLENCI